MLTALENLFNLARERKKSPVDGSYTNKLLSDKSLSKEKVLEEINELIEAVENKEILIDAQNNNEGVLLLFRHSIFLELSARLISEEFSIYGMERPNNSEVIQNIQQRGRLKSMKGLTSNSNVSQLIEWLKEGKTVLYGPDQDYRNKRSVVSKFFNKKCLTTTVPYTLKKVTKCKLIYLDFYKTLDGYKFIFQDISSIASSKQNFADNINAIIEPSVTKAPAHYLWHHRRFKSQAPEIYD